MGRLKNGVFGFVATTVLVAGSLFILGFRVATAVHSLIAKPTPVVNQELPTQPPRTALAIPQSPSQRLAVARRKPKVVRPTPAIVEAKTEPLADRVITAEPSAAPYVAESKPVESTAEVKKKPRGFRVGVSKIAGKIFFLGRKEKVDVGSVESRGESTPVSSATGTSIRPSSSINSLIR